MIGNPIFRREILATSRDLRVIALTLVFVSLLALILVLLWPASGVFSFAAEGSMQIFVIFLTANLTMISLLVPALSSAAVTSERENRSFDLLFTSLLSPTEILTGKLFASLAVILGVVVLSMPVGAVCALSGGVGPELLARCYAVITVAAIVYGIVGLAVSALCKRTVGALVISYATIGVLAGCTWLPAALLGRYGKFREVFQVIRNLSPYDALYALILPAQYSLDVDAEVYGNALSPFSVYLLGMAIVGVIALIVFARSITAAPRPEKVCRYLAGILTALLAALLFGQWHLLHDFQTNKSMQMGTHVREKLIVLAVALDLGLVLIIRGLLGRAAKLTVLAKHDEQDVVKASPREKAKRRCIGLWRNPFYVAEMRSKFFGRPTFILRSLYTCIGVSIALLILVAKTYATNTSADTVRWVAVVFQIGLVSLLAPLVSSGAITDEITGKTILSLRMTPLSALAMVAGKLKAALAYVSVFLASSFPVMLALAQMEAKSAYWRVGVWFGVLVLTALTLTAAGLCASAYSQRTSFATGLSYGFAALLCIGTFGVLLPGAFDVEAQRIVLTLNPIVAALRVTSNEMFSQMPDSTWVRHLALMATFSMALLSLAAVRIYGIFSRRD